MNYLSVKDIIPELLEATERGKLQWEKNTSNQGVITRIQSYRIEIEARLADSNGPDRISIYLWNDDDRILDSDRFAKGTPEYEEYRTYLKSLQRQAENITGVLKDIVSSLRN